MKALLLIFAATASIVAFGANPATEVVDTKGFPSIGAPLVTKLSWNTCAPFVADLDGDGRNDLLLLNNDTGRIELLYQRRPDEAAPAQKTSYLNRWMPVLDNAPFRREFATGSASMLGLAAADLTGNGLTDILFTSGQGGLHVLQQGPRKGEWLEPIKENAAHTGNSGQEEGALLVFPAGQGKNGRRQAVAQQTAEGLAVRVFDKASLKDRSLPEATLLRTAPGGRPFFAPIFAENSPAKNVLGTIRPDPAALQTKDSLLVSFRPILGDGLTFAPETTLRLPASEIDIKTPLTPATAEQPPAYAAVNTRLRAVFSTTFVHDNTPLRNADEAPILSYPFSFNAGTGTNSGTEKRAVAHFDTTGKGQLDIVAADPSSAKLLLYRAQPSGEYASPVEFPTIPNITEFAVSKNRAKTLLALNANDGLLATIQFREDGTPEFPTPLPLPADFKPQHIASDATGSLIAVLAKNKDGNLVLYRLTATPPAPAPAARPEGTGSITIGSRSLTPVQPALLLADSVLMERESKTDSEGTITTGDWRLTPIATFPENHRDATAIQVHDFDGNGLPDVLLFNDRSAPEFFAQRGEGIFEKVANDSPLRRTLLDGLTAADTSWAVIDGKTALLTATQGFLRAFRIAPNGSLEILLQANAHNSGDALRAPLALNPNTIVAWNSTSSALEWFERDGTDSVSWKIRWSTRLPAFVPHAARLQNLPCETSPRLLYTTADAIVQIPTARRGIKAELKRIYESPVPDFTPHDILTGVLQPAKPAAAKNAASPAQPSVVLFDHGTNVLQILHPTASNGRLGEALSFTLFEANPHYNGRRDAGRQPRAALIAKFTEGSAGDLMLLVHDRVFIYPAIRRE